MKPILRSALVTFVASFVALIPVTSLSSGWVFPAFIASLIAALRTFLSWIDPKNPLFGIGQNQAATPDDPEVVDIQG